VRLFVAVWPDVSVSRRLASLQLGGVPGFRPVPPGQLHVTLRFLGEVDEDLLPDLAVALRGAAGGIGGPIHCEAGPATAWFPGGRVLQLPVDGLEEAADAVHNATCSLVPAPDHRGRFTAHLTLGRARAGRLPAAVRDALAGIPFTASFDLESFDLVASDLSAEGPRYATVTKVPLGGSPSSDPDDHGDDDQGEGDGSEQDDE
jgi:RNA 2',3'-cyclic 3'-phosphodiesterase